ncbi:MAG: hypothetical protein GX552_06005 [Chloroflexi bacterium]|jgi:hypothetical protein|nr:hypothetical protein [Chloroflexota bacterium]
MQANQAARASRVDDHLSEAHLHMLREESAIADDVILAHGYRTVTSPKDLLDLGFAPAQRREPGLVWTVHRIANRC